MITDPNKLPSVDGHEWVNTPGYNERAVAGKPLHCVNLATKVSACGIAREEWNGDLFNYTPCLRCLRALKLECKVCRGDGYRCKPCLMSGFESERVRLEALRSHSTDESERNDS